MVTVYETVLDGFTITGGDAKTTYFQQGGGLDCEPGNSICSPTLSRLVFMGNRAVSGGGAYLGSLPIADQPDPSVPTLGNDDWTSYAVAHKAIIDRFGRFPHRNAVLGRRPTADEIEFLKKDTG